MALVIRRTFIDVEESEEGCQGLLHRSCSDGALMNMAHAAGWRMMMESAQLPDSDDDMLDGEVTPARSTAEDPKQIGDHAFIARTVSSSSTSCPSEVEVSRSVSWADADQDDISLGSWGSPGPASEEGDLNQASPRAEAPSKDARGAARCSRGKRGGAAGRRQKAAREMAISTPEAQHAKASVCQDTAEQQAEGEERSTLVLQSLDSNILRSEVQAMLDDEGFAGAYDFLYVPMDFNTRGNLGHAIINFSTKDAAAAFQKAFEGRVEVNTPINGLDNLMRRYRNSPVMHPAVPDEYRPVVFRAGRRTDFLAPTCEVRLLRAFSEQRAEQ